MGTPFKMKGPSLYNSPMKQDEKKDGKRETSWWKGEEGLIPDEFQPNVNRKRVNTSLTNQNNSKLSTANMKEAQKEYSAEMKAWKEGGSKGTKPISLDARLKKSDGITWNNSKGWK